MPDPAAIRAFLDKRHGALVEELRSFVGSQVASLRRPDKDEEAREQAREVLRRLGNAGWLGYCLPRSFGGRTDEPDLRACALIREELAYESPLADAVFALQALGSMPLVLFGDEEQKRRYLPAAGRGEAMAAFAMTEPEAGSDVSSLRTRAVRDGGGYVLDGTKTLISNAGIADHYVVFATLDPSRGRSAITAFVVDAEAPGLFFGGAQILSAPHPLGLVRFERCRLPASGRLGREGQGFEIGMAALDRMRATVGAAACGMAARALDEAIAHAKTRVQFGKPLSELQLTRWKLAKMATELCAARLLVYRAAWESDHGARRVTAESAMAKAYATEAAQRIVDDALQICGGSGVLAGHPVEHLYRAVRSLRIYEGTTEIQHLVIAAELLKERAAKQGAPHE